MHIEYIKHTREPYDGYAQFVSDNKLVYFITHNKYIICVQVVRWTMYPRWRRLPTLRRRWQHSTDLQRSTRETDMQYRGAVLRPIQGSGGKKGR